MGTGAKLAGAQLAVQKAGTLAEAQAILDRLVAEEQEVTDIFYTQEFMIESLTDLLEKQDREKPQPVYISPQAPQPQPKNYLLYIGIGIAILVLTGKLKL